MKRTVIFLVILMLFSESCTMIDGDTVVISGTLTKECTNLTTATPILPLIPGVTSTSVHIESQDCWSTVWEGSINEYGQLLRIVDGDSGSLWLLYENILILLSSGKNEQIYDLQKILDCKKCLEVINETLVVASNGEIWIGLSTGVLIVTKTGDWKKIETATIFPQNNGRLNANVLVTDSYGRTWVNIENFLCSFDGKIWDCKPIPDLDGYDPVISGINGKGDQIWFATYYGKIIRINDGEIATSEIPVEGFRNVSMLAFDHKNDTLWAVSFSVAVCQDQLNNCPPKILQIKEDGSYIFHNLSQFVNEKYGSVCAPPTLTSIAVTPDGKVWLGMMFCYSLVYYDGVNWKSLDGVILPYSASLIPENGIMESCLLSGYIAKVFVTKSGQLLVSNQAGNIITLNQ